MKLTELQKKDGGVSFHSWCWEKLFVRELENGYNYIYLFKTELRLPDNTNNCHQGLEKLLGDIHCKSKARRHINQLVLNCFGEMVAVRIKLIIFFCLQQTL